MELKNQIQDDIKTAMKARDKEKVSTIRLILAAIKQREVDERIELDDAQIIATLDKMAKQRRESIQQFNQGNRPDLVATEQAELDIIQAYLPQPLTETELHKLLDQAISNTQANGIRDMGKVMTYLKPHIQGRADGGKVSQMVKDRLG